jgi:hypothetical protein
LKVEGSSRRIGQMIISDGNWETFEAVRVGICTTQRVREGCSAAARDPEWDEIGSGLIKYGICQGSNKALSLSFFGPSLPQVV